MKEELDKTYRGFRGWIQYIRDYKDNVDNDLISQQRLIDAERIIQRLKIKIRKQEDMSREKDNLLEMRLKRVEDLTSKLRQSKQDNITKQNIIGILNEQLDTITTKYNEIEHKRRINAIEIGHRQRKINKLEKELERANQKITWLKNNQKAPTKEEIIAYETRMKEVEKRIKGKSE